MLFLGEDTKHSRLTKLARCRSDPLCGKTQGLVAFTAGLLQDSVSLQKDLPGAGGVLTPQAFVVRVKGDSRTVGIWEIVGK